MWTSMTYLKQEIQLKMKISRKIIRAIIKEEIKRDLPLKYYSDEMLMQEGLLDWLSDLFGKFVSFFTGSAEKGSPPRTQSFANLGPRDAMQCNWQSPRVHVLELP